MFNKSSFAKGIQSFSTLCREDVFLETARVSAMGRRTESRDGDNFQTLKMISGQNAAGQGLKWPVGSERGVERDVGREKLVYKHKLRKYITKCNGESEVAAWSAPSKSGLFNPEKATPVIYYAILLQGNCVFISGLSSRSEPQRLAFYLNFCLLFFNAHRSCKISRISTRSWFKILYSFPQTPLQCINVVNVKLLRIYYKPRNILLETHDDSGAFSREKSKHSTKRAFSRFNAFGVRATLALLIRKALSIPGEAFSAVEYRREKQRGKESCSKIPWACGAWIGIRAFVH